MSLARLRSSLRAFLLGRDAGVGVDKDGVAVSVATVAMVTLAVAGVPPPQVFGSDASATAVEFVGHCLHSAWLDHINDVSGFEFPCW